ncbi:MAG: polymer-forming cytoskeletal protein [Planctomycetota bacterium]
MSIRAAARRGIALVPAMLLVSGLAIFAMALLTTVLTGKRTTTHQSDDFKLSSAVESVAILAVDEIWSGYLASQGGAADSIDTFRFYLLGMGIPDSGPGGPPKKDEGTDLLPLLGLPAGGAAPARFNDVNVDSLRMVRRDAGESTQLFVTVSASTSRGQGILNPVLNRAVQQVYTVEPEDFAGFDYAILANNVNCIFCHTSVDSVDRQFNLDPDEYGSFPRVKVGTLESLVLRKDLEGCTWDVTDGDADSFVAGTVYTRGLATDHAGSPIADWGALTFKGYAFDADGNIVQDSGGEMSICDFVPAGDPPGSGENLYLDYPTEYAEQVDGSLPRHFPPPIPDDGGIDPDTGLPDTTGAENRLVDDFEYAAIASTADGAITAGILNVTDHDEILDTPLDLGMAVWFGNTSSIQQSVVGNVILTGTPDNPITIDGTVAIDGDLMINGYVKGEGALIVRGNVYAPTDIVYLDGREYVEGDVPGSPTGPRTFGIAPDGTRNALGLAAGGNVMIGDYQRPAKLQWDWTYETPGKYETISGNPDTGDPMLDDWSFALSELAIFNRGEWARTQPMLPGAPGEADLDPSQWTAVNPDYDPDYVPRYYGYEDDTILPFFNRGDVYYDVSTRSWRAIVEVPIAWDPAVLSYADPTDPADPYLYNADGTPKAARYALQPTNGWIENDVYKTAVEYFSDQHAWGDPIRIDGLLYTNNSIFTIVNRDERPLGTMVVNGALVAADLGVLVPGVSDPGGYLANHSPLSDFAIGLQLNYDRRVKNMLNVANPYQVQLKRTYWNPTANIQ